MRAGTLHNLAREELAKRSAGLSRSLDKPFEEAAEVFVETLASIEEKTKEERLDLLRRCLTFVETQRVYVEGKIRSLEAK